MKLQVLPSSKVSTLKGVISNRIKLARDKIVLLQRNRQLTEGTLEENHVTDGARLMLVPCVEAGLLASRPEHSVLKALNTLTDTQVDNVLTGRVPLNLTMRFGGHMMFIQLQLATGAPPPPQPTSTHVFPPTPPSTPTSVVSPSAFPMPTTPPASPDRTLKGEPQWPQVSQTSSPAGTSNRGAPVWTQPSPSSQPGSGPAVTGAPSASSSNVSTSHSSSLAAQELALASRHLTQTLKQLSSVAMGAASAAAAAAATRATPVNTPEKCQNHHCPRQQNGAVIESLYHHGKGIYSGTFVGTLSPSLQDMDGRPRPNISTIVHILNDLLGASLQCQSSSSSSSSSPSSSASSTAATSHSGSVSTCNCTSDTHPVPLASPTPLQPQSAHTVNVDADRQTENQAIRGKMEQLQNLLEERRQRRKARREVRSSPYHLLAPPKGKPHDGKPEDTAV